MPAAPATTRWSATSACAPWSPPRSRAGWRRAGWWRCTSRGGLGLDGLGPEGGGLVALHEQGRFVFDGLVHEGLPLVIVWGVCGAAALALLAAGARRGPRPLAVGAVAAVVWGWGVAQHPYLLPRSLSIDA